MGRQIDTLIVSRYVAGDSLRTIATEEAISIQTIYNALSRNGVKTRQKTTAAVAAQFAKAVETQSIEDAAGAFGISARTGNRIIRALRDQGERVDVRRGRPLTGSPEDQAVRRLWKSPFPYPTLLDAEETRIEFERLKNTQSFLDGEEIRPRSNTGLRLCYPYFPNRYAAKSGDNLSAVEAWSAKNELRRAVRLQIAYDDPTTPHRVLRAITLQCRTPTIFRPGVAKFICGRYTQPGDLVWDPCSGYGGRLLGAAAAGVRYIGTDVDADTVSGNLQLARAVCSSAQVIQCPAEDFAPPSDVALVFTSPPYFDRERYSDAAAQSWKRYDTVEKWIAGFLVPVIARAQQCLRSSGRLVINVADVQSKGRVVPVVAETIRTAVLFGFHHNETLQMPIAGINRKNPSEPILVFQK